MPELERRRTGDRLSSALTWLTGGALALDLLMIGALLGLVGVRGCAAFWPRPLVEVQLDDGTRWLGEPWGRETIPEREGATRVRLRTGNRDLGGPDFRWIDEARIVGRRRPAGALLLERLEWGPFYGFPRALRVGERVLASDPEGIAHAFPQLHEEKRRIWRRIRAIEKGPVGELNRGLEEVRLARRRLDLESPPPAVRAQDEAPLQAREARLQAAYEKRRAELETLRRKLAEGSLVMQTADGRVAEIPVGKIVRAIEPNRLGLAGTLEVYASRLREFVFDEPREANTEGGIFPALFGTVLMVFVMSLFVVPFGVLAAAFLREYAREGWMVRAVRIAVNNLAGVPSIVFGVFGLGFFVYGVGGTLDRIFFPEALPTPTYGTGGILWASLTLALLTVPVVIVSTEEGLAAVPRGMREGSRALGATRFETLRRVVLPAAAPGILTGLILAMARAAGEVAPLMIVGMVKLAPELPLDHHFPWIHLDRKFMHLGFHIYDVGFQSPNVEAAKPLVYATTALLITLVVGLNLGAILLRNRLRRALGSQAGV